MGYGVRLRVWGDRACFTRPEMKVERVSYDVITPSAARGIIEAIHWKPAIEWHVDRIHVLREIKFDNVRRNELAGVISARAVRTAMRAEEGNLGQVIGENRQQRATLMLRDVEYIIEAHFEMTGLGGEEDTEEKHYNMFLRRARQGQCWQRPYLGCREFAASFELAETLPISPLLGERDLGWMLLDIDFENDMQPQFFRAHMVDGVIDVPSRKGGVLG